jgi:nitrogen fixation/metabolism regulation signal transduction histidine kinase
VKIMANPVVLRAAVVFFCASFAFLLGLIFIRLLRKSITDEADISSESAPALEAFPMHVYNTVIQQLKQQKHELQVQWQAEQYRARTTETLSQAVLFNLSSGVLVFGTNGLVKTSNPAAKEILGFASTTGMCAEDIFRGAVVSNAAASGVFPDGTGDETFDEIRLADEVDVVLHEGGDRREVEAEYETPLGESRFLSVTVSPVPATDGSLLGVACLINDLSELEHIRRQQAQRGEISAEMALRLRTSLTTISSYAQELAAAGDPAEARQLAADIAHEAADLDRSLGGFLTEKRAGVAAGAGSVD